MAEQPPLRRVEQPPLEPIYKLVRVTPESVTEQPSNRVLLNSSPPETNV